MSDVNDTLLPPTATPLAKALDVLEERLFRLPVEVVSKNPDTVDVGWLDHLAWEHSVDVWDTDWPESIKRSVIAVSAEVHRFKGTPHAIRTALAAFDVDTKLLEWFAPEGIEAGLERGSFQVTAYAGGSLYGPNENTIDARMLNAMTSVVQRVAPVSRKLSFRLGERFSSKGCFRTGQRTVVVTGETHEIKPRPALAAASVFVRLAACGRAVSKESHHVQRRPAG